MPQGSTITWRVTGSDTASNFTGLTGSTTTSSAVDCPQAPSSSSISQSLGSCSGDGGSKTSTLTITNGDSATRYFKVEYSIDGGTYTSVNANFSLGASSSDSTTFTQAVSNGSAITWRVTGSDTDGDFTGLTASTVSSSAVNCNDPSLTVTESFTGSCSSGSKTNTLSILNNESYTAYAYVEYKITDSSNNDSAWTVHPSGSNVSITAGVTNTDLTVLVEHGSKITWRVNGSQVSGSYSGTGTAISASSAVDCPVTDITASDSMGSCANGAKVSTFEIQNGSGANTTAYVHVQYKINSGSWTTQTSHSDGGNIDLASGASAVQITQTVAHGETIQWRYEVSTTDNTYTGSYQLLLAQSAVDCPFTDVSVSKTLGTCSSGTGLSTFTMTNSSSATTSAYIKVQYKITDNDGNDGGWVDYDSDSNGAQDEITVGVNSSGTATYNVPVGSKITWRYEVSTSSGGQTGSYTTDPAGISSAVSCSISTTVTQALDSSCSGASKNSVLTLNNGSGSQTIAYFKVQYKIDSGSYQDLTGYGNKAVIVSGSDATATVAVPNGSNITWRYEASSISGSFTGSYTEVGPSATVSCTTPSVSAVVGSCSSGSANITITLDNTGQGASNYFKVQYSTNGGVTWTDGAGTDTYATVTSDNSSDVNLASSAFAHGDTVKIRYETSSTTTFTGSWETDIADITIDCPVLSGSATASANTCSSGSATISITLDNTASNVSGDFTVRYSTDDSASFTTFDTTTVGAGATDSTTLTIPAQAHTTTVVIKYSVANAANSLSQSEASVSAISDITIDCEVKVVTAAHALNGCKNNGTGQQSTLGKSKINVDNSGSNVAVTVLLQRRTTNAVTGNVSDWGYFFTGETGGASGTTIAAGVADTEFNFNNPGTARGTGLEHRFSIDGGTTWTEITTNHDGTGDSKITPTCAYVTTSIGSCTDSLTQVPSITIANGADNDKTMYFRVQYSTDNENWTTLLSDESVTVGNSSTHSAPCLLYTSPSPRDRG